MKKLDERIWYGVFAYRQYNVIAQEIDSTDPLYRRWAAIYIMEKNINRKDLSKILESGIHHKYLMVLIDICLDFLTSYDTGYDVDIDIAKDTQLIYSRGFDNEETLYRICTELNLNPEKFNTPWRVGYILE